MEHDTSCQTYQQKALLIHGRNEQGANSQAAPINGREVAVQRARPRFDSSGMGQRYAMRPNPSREPNDVTSVAMA